MLLTNDVKPSTQIQTLSDFQTHFVETGLLRSAGNFKDWVLRINRQEPSASFAVEYLNDSKAFLDEVYALRRTEKNNVTETEQAP
jgi:sulfite reductase (ferredoxin)